MAKRPQSGAALLAEEMRSTLAPVRVEAGETVVRQGDEGRGFYLVESGVLDVVVTCEEDVRLPVARLGPGSHFGEMSLLGEAPVSADVVASEPSVLYAAAPEEFDELIRRKPELIHYLAGELALRLKQTDEQLAAQQRRQATLSKLIGSRPTSPFKSDLPSLGRQMMAALSEAGNSNLPLLIAGEKGVGKRAAALYIHSMGARRDRAVLVVDCRELPPDEARGQLFGDAHPEFLNRFADQLGYLQAADRGTLVLANVDRLPAEVQEELSVFLCTHEDAADESRVAVRVISTVDTPVETSGLPSGLCDALAQRFTDAQMIKLQPLRKRRRDIIPLAEHFLQQAAQLSDSPLKHLSESARRKLLTHDFRFENAEELRQVVNLGADLADAEVVSAEHLFFGAGVGAEAPQIDLLRWPWVEQTLRQGYPLTGAKVLTGIAFGGIIAACLAAPDSRLGQVTNVMVWGLWWPALVVLSILLGRIWCAVCPLSSGAEAAQRTGGRDLAPTDRLKEAGPLLALVGFAGIIWIEHVAGMSTNPRATAVLLLSLAAIAAAVGWLYQRHTWCRYLCPLGAMCAIFSTASALRIRARREVCQASCAGNECYRGSELAKGCPMFNHAMFLNSGQHCKLCLECLRACPVYSPRLVLQFPLRDIWQSDLISTDVAPLTVVVGLMALLLAATPIVGTHSLLGGWWFTLGTLAVVAVGLALRRSVWSPQRAESSGGLSWTGRAVFAYAPAVAAVLFAFHILSLPWLDEISLRIGRDSVDLLGGSLLHITQVAALGLGGLMTLWGLWRLCHQTFGPRLLASVAVWVPAGIVAAAYLVVGLTLLGRA
jgi:transcriptional regulator with AAA-type ATPase domain/polyferredoxin